MSEIKTWWERMGCIRKPNYDTGAQIAMQNEIDELREVLRIAEAKLEYANDMIPCFDELMNNKEWE